MELVNWLFANHPFSPKKRHEGKLLILEMLLESISAFQLRKSHFDSNLGIFLVILLSSAQRSYCVLIFSSKLPTLVASLRTAWFSLLLVHFSANSINLAYIFFQFSN
jgi:hypothetical protein